MAAAIRRKLTLECVEGMVRGDQAAWDDVAARFDPLVRGWLYRQGVPRSDTDDLSQDVWCRALTVRERFRIGDVASGRREPGRAVGAWLRMLTRYTALDYFRERGSDGRRLVLPDVGLFAVYYVLPSPWDLVPNLNPRAAAVLGDRLAGRTWKEAGERVGVSPATAWRVLHRDVAPRIWKASPPDAARRSR